MPSVISKDRQIVLPPNKSDFDRMSVPEKWDISPWRRDRACNEVSPPRFVSLPYDLACPSLAWVSWESIAQKIEWKETHNDSNDVIHFYHPPPPHFRCNVGDGACCVFSSRHVVPQEDFVGAEFVDDGFVGEKLNVFGDVKRPRRRRTWQNSWRWTKFALSEWGKYPRPITSGNDLHLCIFAWKWHIQIFPLIALGLICILQW